jgi:hypothetical protein
MNKVHEIVHKSNYRFVDPLLYYLKRLCRVETDVNGNWYKRSRGRHQHVRQETEEDNVKPQTRESGVNTHCHYIV